MSQELTTRRNKPYEPDGRSGRPIVDLDRENLTGAWRSNNPYYGITLIPLDGSFDASSNRDDPLTEPTTTATGKGLSGQDLSVSKLVPHEQTLEPTVLVWSSATLSSGAKTVHQLLGSGPRLTTAESVPSYEWKGCQTPLAERLTSVFVTQVSTFHVGLDVLTRLLESVTGIFIYNAHFTPSCFRVNTLNDNVRKVLYDNFSAQQLWVKKESFYEMKILSPRIGQLPAKTLLKDIEAEIKTKLMPFNGSKWPVTKNSGILSVTIPEDAIELFMDRLEGRLLQDIQGSFWVANTPEEVECLAEYAKTLEKSDGVRRANLPHRVVRVEKPRGKSEEYAS